MRRRQSICIVLAGLVSLLLVSCDHPLNDDLSEEVIQDRLLGAWLREFEEKGVAVRRVLVLETDGKFSEKVRIVEAGGAVTAQVHTGLWFYDGTNLKRKYTSMNGKPPAAPTISFVTFELKFVSKNEFIGIDRVRRREVRYQRVPLETAP